MIDNLVVFSIYQRRGFDNQAIDIPKLCCDILRAQIKQEINFTSGLIKVPVAVGTIVS